MKITEVKPEELLLNPFTSIGTDWMLITAGDEKKYNTMTAAWGGLGVIWSKNAATCYIRPQRYTREFVDANDTFTLSFFGPEYREQLTYCGRNSGRDCDKAAETGLTPLFIDGTTAFQEAKLILICRKLYRQELLPEKFIDSSLDAANYPDHDYHIMYIGEVKKIIKIE